MANIYLYLFYALVLGSGVYSYFLFYRTYRRSGRQCFFDYLLFLLSLTLLVGASTVSMMVHGSTELAMVTHRLIVSVQLFSMALVVYTLPHVLLSTFYLEAAKTWHYFFTNLFVVTLLFIPTLWLWPSITMIPFPLTLGLVTLALVLCFFFYILYHNRDELINALPLSIKFILIIFFLLLSIILFSEFTLFRQLLPGLSISLALIYLIWNILSWVLLSTNQDTALALTSDVQAFKQLFQLTEQETMMVEKIIQGKFNHEIASELNLPKSLLLEKLTALFAKTKVKNRIDLLQKIHHSR